MPDPILRGTGSPLQQEASQAYDPVHGYMFGYHFKGVSVTAMLALQSEYSNLGMPSRLVAHQGGMVSLDVEDPTQQFNVDTWQLVGNEINIDGFSHPTMLAILASNDQYIEVIRLALDNNTKPADLKTSLTGLGMSSANADTTLVFYGLNRRGSTEFRVAQYVVRHTSNLPNRFTNAQGIYTSGVNQIFSPAKALLDFNAAAWSPAMPSSMLATIKAVTDNPPAAVDRYLFGWLKGSPTFTSAANNRVDANQEYTLYQWSTDYYPNPVV